MCASDGSKYECEFSKHLRWAHEGKAQGYKTMWLIKDTRHGTIRPGYSNVGGPKQTKHEVILKSINLQGKKK